MKITYIYTHADVNVKHMYDLPHGHCNFPTN